MHPNPESYVKIMWWTKKIEREKNIIEIAPRSSKSTCQKCAKNHTR